MDEVRDEATATATAEVVPLDDRNLRGMQLARSVFPDEDRQQLAAMLSVPSESPALLPFLALCISEGYSPWANHVWLIPKKFKIKGVDGQEDREETKYLPAVGRDGLLFKARQSKGKPGGYRGMKFGVVCERDSFEVEQSADFDSAPNVLHRFASKPTTFEPNESAARWRGRVIGAWATCFVDGEPPTFYYANLLEHGKLKQTWDYSEAARKRQPLYRLPDGSTTFNARAPHAMPVQEWEGAWDYTSTMVLKAAQSYVLRIALGVTGVVPVDELRDASEWSETTGRPVDAGAAAGTYTPPDDEDTLTAIEPEELRERIRAALQRVNHLSPMAWGPAKIEMVLKRRTPEELGVIVEGIEREIATLEAHARAAEERAAAEEAKITDAEVVGGGDAEPAPAGTSEEPGETEMRAERQTLLREVATAQTEGAELAARAKLDQIEAAMRDRGFELT